MPPEPTSPDPRDAQFEAIRQFVASVYPGHPLKGVAVRVEGVKGWMRVPLPPAAAAEEEGLTASRMEVVDALRKVPFAITRKQLQKGLGHKVQPKGVTGRLASDIKWLVEGGHIFEHRGHLTDDRDKFEATDFEE